MFLFTVDNVKSINATVGDVRGAVGGGDRGATARPTTGKEVRPVEVR